MKTEIKDPIKQMRNDGKGYKKIAKELSLTPSAVRYACHKMSEELLNGKCENCGIKIKSIKGKKKKRFCSDRCRWDWWNNFHKKK
jgi:predicted transcriptional regulator